MVLPVTCPGQRARLAVAIGVALCALVHVAPASAQIRTGGLTGTVEDPAGARIAGQQVEVIDPATGQRWRVVTDSTGAFVVTPLPYGRYTLTVRPASGFRMFVADVVVHSNVPTVAAVRLSLAAFDDSQVVSALVEDALPLTTRSELRVNREMAVMPAQRATSLASLLAGAPGVARAHNALVHVRGVEDGLLYVVDGVPVTERYDALHASAFELESFDAITLVTGNLPAEFGGRSGAVVSLDRAPERRRFGYARIGGGNQSTADGAAGGGALVGSVYLAGSIAGSVSDRFLDPVDEGNFNNQGERLGASLHGMWRAMGASQLTFGIAGARTRMDVPNDAEQQDAGQRQTQSLDDENVSFSWQRAASDKTVGDIAAFHRRYAGQLTGSPFDVPIAARSDRAHTRTGALGSVTHQRGRHVVKAGFEASRVAPDEWFGFAITDEEMARDRDVSEPALEFGPDDPFIFADSRVGSYLAAFLQDDLALGPNVRLDVGLRVERASLPQPATQWSPRLGAAVAIPRTNTVARGSFNRLFMPPHIEHLLVANSEEARALSPFAGGGQEGGADVRPERVTAFELGIAQELGGGVSLDVTYWDRRFDDVADPNVFFNTTIVFPNSVAAGSARGLDVRFAVRERRGVSGFLNYTHARVHNVGPITGGLFLTDEFIEIGPGVVFEPDHDQPHIVSAGVRVRPSSRWWLALDVRHGGGGPLEVEEDDIDEVIEEPGGDLIDVDRGRMTPWSVFDVASSLDLMRGRGGQLALRVDLQNVIGTRFAYTVGNPFEGTRFGHPRLVRVGLQWRWPG